MGSLQDRTQRREHAQAQGRQHRTRRLQAREGSPTIRNRIRINARKGAPKMIAVPQPSARPGGSTGTSRARRRVSCKGTPRRARVPPVDYRDGLSPYQRHPSFPLHASRLTQIEKQEQHLLDPPECRQAAGFRSERVAGFNLECMAGFIGIRSYPRGNTLRVRRSSRT
jgi:hypothetical protein